MSEHPWVCFRCGKGFDTAEEMAHEECRYHDRPSVGTGEEAMEVPRMAEESILLPHDVQTSYVEVPYYACCKMPLGTPGCQTAPKHDAIKQHHHHH